MGSHQIIGYIIGVIGLLGVAFGVSCYMQLRKWAYLFRHGRVVVAYKNKVKLNAPLEEWALWCANAEKEGSGTGPRFKKTGRILYQYGGTSIAVLGKSFMPDPIHIRLLNRVKGRIKSPTRTNPQVQEGTWSAEDQTVK